MKSNILITGGLGFIASHLSRLLLNSGYNVIIVDKGTYAADIRRIEDIKDDVKLYMGDICNRKLIEKIIKEDNIDTILNAAAFTHVDNVIKDSEPFIYSNYVGVWNLLEIIRKNKENYNNIRFCHVSSDEVYGSTKCDDDVFKETDKLNPGNPYSSFKAGADILCLSYANTYNLDITITRSSNNYGPCQHVEKFIPRMITLAIQGKDLEVYGNGNNVRDWLYVEDHCLGIKKVMEDGRIGDIYNICSYEEKTNNQVAEMIAERFDVGIEHIEDRKGHDFRYSINCNKIMRELGWECKVDFEEGIVRTIEWHIEKYGDILNK